MSPLKPLLLTHAQILQQMSTQQLIFARMMAQDIHGVSPDFKQQLLQMATDCMERFKIIGESSRLIREIDDSL